MRIVNQSETGLICDKAIAAVADMYKENYGEEPEEIVDMTRYNGLSATRTFTFLVNSGVVFIVVYYGGERKWNIVLYEPTKTKEWDDKK